MRHLLAQRRLVLLICAAALVLKLLVPAGCMIDGNHGRLSITICSGMAQRTVTMDAHGMHRDMPDHGKSEDHGKAELPCAFSSLTATSLATIDPIQLAALIAFVMSVGLAGIALPPPSRRTQLRPPLRGPPAYL